MLTHIEYERKFATGTTWSKFYSRQVDPNLPECATLTRNQQSFPGGITLEVLTQEFLLLLNRHAQRSIHV